MSDFLSKVIPSEPVAASLVNPRTLVLYKDLKIGASTLAAWLSVNKKAVWADLEQGSGGFPGRGVDVVRKAVELKMTCVAFFQTLCKEMAEANLKALTAGQPLVYDYLVVDKLDQLETWAEGWATADYKNSIIGRDFKESTVAALPYIGWGKIHDKFALLWNAAKAAAPHVIFIGTAKTSGASKFGSHEGVEQGVVCSTDLDLGTRQRKTAVGDSDATGLLYRDPDGANYVSFVSRERGAFTGNRIPRLEGRKIKLSWFEKDDPKKERLRVDWGSLYIEPAVNEVVKS